MIRFIAGLLLAGAPALLMAGAISIVPLRVELGKARTASLTITNENVSRTFEVRVTEWSQDNGVDSYAPTDELLAVPSTFRLDQGASQVIRVTLNIKPDTTEHAYRVFLNEIVPAPEVAAGSVVTTALSVGIPAFVLPQGGRPPKGKLDVKAEKTPTGIRIVAQNGGVANLKAEEITVESSGTPLIRVTPGDYVLSDAARTWEYPLRQAAGGPLTVSIRTDRGTFSASTR